MQSVVVWLALWAVITDAEAVFLHVMAYETGDVCMAEASAFVQYTKVLEYYVVALAVQYHVVCTRFCHPMGQQVVCSMARIGLVRSQQIALGQHRAIAAR